MAFDDKYFSAILRHRSSVIAFLGNYQMAAPGRLRLLVTRPQNRICGIQKILELCRITRIALCTKTNISEKLNS